MIVDVWAQPPFAARPGRLPVPEACRVFERSGSAGLLTAEISPGHLVALMDAAETDVVLLSAWHRPGGWVLGNGDIAAFTAHTPGVDDECHILGGAAGARGDGGLPGRVTGRGTGSAGTPRADALVVGP